jgi:asparagine synthase (glutamine-hydrolysing)
MLAAQAVHGRHACDQWDGTGISMGRRLFRLLPEDVFDKQPLAGAGGRLTLVADVRLDNRKELESALELPADQASRTCDAEVLLAAWERWGEDSFDRLVGEYAFAVWDADRSVLILARDPFGERALHFHRGGRFFAFASMPKGLHALPDVPRSPDTQQCIDFLLRLPHVGSGSFFKGVDRVEPGCFVKVTDGGVQSTRHWRPRRLPIRLKTSDDYVAAMREQLEAAVRPRLRCAGGGVAAHLSAGLDSSAVATTAARLLASSGRRLVAFTAVPVAGYNGPAIEGLFNDEGPLAAATAAMHPNIDHILVRSSGRLQTDALDRDYFLHDKPTPNRCNQDWINEIDRVARDRGLAVLLTGGLGNLTFSCKGLDALPNAVRERNVGSWWRIARRAVAAGTLRWKGVMFHSLGPWMPDMVWRRLNQLRGGYADDLPPQIALNPDLRAFDSRNRRLRERGWDPLPRCAADSFMDRFIFLSTLDQGNDKSARLAAWGVDERDPTADRRFVEFSLNLPPEQFMAGGVMRSLARRTLADRVPAVVLSEPLNGGQAADWHVAMTAGRDELASQVERLGQNDLASSVLDIPRLLGLIRNWPSDGWERPEIYMQYRTALLSSLSVGHFLIRASGSNQ